MSRPKRLKNFEYLGPRRYFLTFCVRDRLPVFNDRAIANQTLTQFRRTSALERFAILAYCLMPDHVHLLAEGLAVDADLKRFAKMAKQRSGAVFARSKRSRLWQEGYYERVLRDDDDARELARYIVNNPVRAGLVESPGDYPFAGSDVWSLEICSRASCSGGSKDPPYDSQANSVGRVLFFRPGEVAISALIERRVPRAGSALRSS